MTKSSQFIGAAAALSLLSSVFLFQNCAKSGDSATPNTAAASSGGIYSPTGSNSYAISTGNIPAGVTVDCSYLSPSAIKSLGTDVVQWLATIQPSGLTLHEQYIIAREQGYTGAFGAGQHSAWLAADTTGARQATFDAAVLAYANQAVPPYASWIQHHTARRAAGYNGVFLCGGDACFQQGQCDNLGRDL